MKKIDLLNKYIYISRKYKFKNTFINKCIFKFICFFQSKSYDYNSYLENFSADPRSSSFCKNEIAKSPKYDLQIIIPAFNVENYIENCINSILNQQTQYSYCIIIINDGSTDNTYSKIKKINDKRICIYNQENKGFSCARNKGLEFINAKYVMFVDSDDMIPQNTIEVLLNEAFTTNACIVEGTYNYIKNDIFIDSEINSNTRTQLYGQPWGKVYRASLFENIKFPEKYWFEDTIGVYLVYPKAEKIKLITKLVYNYRLNPNGITYTFMGKNKSIDSLYITEQMLKDRMKINLPINQELYEITLSQIRMNFFRTKFLGDKINYSVFKRTCNFFNYYFPNYKTKIIENKLLEKSLNNNNYPLYLYTLISY